MENKYLYGTVRDVKIDPKNGRSYVTVELPDGSMVGGYAKIDESPSVNKTNLDYKLLKFTPESSAFLQVREGDMALMSSPDNGFITHKDFGNYILGPTVFTTHPEGIRVNGVYRINGQITSTMASTIVTPIPFLILDLPGEGLVKTMTNILSEHKAMLGL